MTQSHQKPAPGWTLVLRRQPVHLVEGRYTDACELICYDCTAGSGTGSGRLPRPAAQTANVTRR